MAHSSLTPHLQPLAPTTDRRHLLRTAGRGVLAAGLGGLAARGGWLTAEPALAASTGEKPLRIGYLPITDASALIAAHELGFFADAGVPSARPVLFRSWEALAQALVVGEVDAVHLLLPFALQLRLQQRAPVKVVAWGHTNGSALTVRRDVTSLAQLAGQRLAVPYWWSIHSVLAQRQLRQAGLRPVIRETPSASARTVELLVMAPADMVGALAGGTIAGFAVADPFNAVAEAQSVGRIHRFLGDVWHDHACCAITVRDQLIDERPSAVQAITDAVAAAHTWLDGHRGEASALLGRGYLPQPQPAVNTVFTRTPGASGADVQHPDWHGERLGFTSFPHAGYTAALVEALRTTRVDGDAAWLPTDAGGVHGELVDDRFITATLTRAGTRPSPRTEEIA